MRSVQCLAAAAALCALTAAGAAEDGRVDVSVIHTGTDGAGKRLAAALAAELRSSKRLNLVGASDERIGLYLATMPRDGATIYSATWTFGGMADDGYFTSTVGACEADAIRSCARRLAAETDRHGSVLAGAKASQGKR